MTTPPPISVRPPLPCSALADDGVSRCGRDAAVGTLYPMGGGQCLLQPLCRGCVAGLQRVYGDSAPPGSRTTPTYTIAADGDAITCLLCGKTSHHPQDVEYRYCGACRAFHEPAQLAAAPSDDPERSQA